MGLLGFWEATAQTDRTFWFVASDVQQGHGDRPIFLRLITRDSAAEVEITQPANAGFAPILRSIPPNSTATVDLTPFINQIESTPPNTILSNGLLITADNPINAYYDVANASNPDLYPLKGSNALGTLFFVPSQNRFANIAAASYESFEVLATQDNTTIEITVTADIVGHPAGSTFTVVLNRGEAFTAEGLSQAANVSLAGSKIVSDKPVAVTGSDDSIGAGTAFAGYDLIGDQLVPVRVLGTEYIAIRGFANQYEHLYVVATADATEVFTNGNAAPLATLNAGDLLEIPFDLPTIYLEASAPVYALHLSGHNTEFGSALLPHIVCTGTDRVRFVRNSEGNFALLLLVPTGSEGDFTLNGDPSLIQAGDFAAVTGTGGSWQFARLEFNNTQVPTGVASTIENSSNVFHVGMLNQLGGSSSYGFFSDYSSLNLGGDREICAGQTLELNAGAGRESYLWSNGATTPQITVADTGTYWVQTVANNCTLSDTVRVRPRPLSVAQIRYAGTPEDTLYFCPETPAQTVSALAPTHAPSTTYQWRSLTTGTTLASAATLTLETQTQRYEVTVAEPGNRCPARDTLTVIYAPLAQAEIRFNGQAEDTVSVCDDQETPLRLTAFYDNPNPALTYTWTQVETASSSTGTTLDVFHPGENFTYWLTVDDPTQPPGCEQFLDTVLVQFLPLPEAEILWQDTPTDTFRLCDTDGPQTLYANAITHTGNNFSYQWRNLSNDELLSEADTVVLRTFSDSVGIELLVQREEDNGLICEQRDTLIAVFYPAANAQEAGLPTALFTYCDSDGPQTIEAAAPNSTFTITYAWTDITDGANPVFLSDNRELTVSNFSDTTVYQIDITTQITAVQCQNRDTATVIFYANPEVSISEGTSLTFCDSDGSQTLTAQASGTTNATFAWFSHDPATGATTPLGTGATLSVANFSSTAEYRVILTDNSTANTCQASATTRVTFLPVPSFTLPEEVFICESSTTLETSLTGNYTYAWTSTSGITANTPALTITEAGTYTLRITDNDNGCFAERSSQVRIPGELPARITFDQTAIYCLGDTLLLDAQHPAHNANTRYAWDNGQSTPSIRIRPTNSGTGTVQLTITDALTGCSRSTSQTYFINALPDLSPLRDTLRFCAPTDTLGRGLEPSYAYRWTGPGILTNPNQRLIRINAEGKYDLRATITETGCRSAASVRVIFHPLPLLELNDARVCTNDSVALVAQDLTHGTWARYAWRRVRDTAQIGTAGLFWLRQSDTLWVRVTDSRTGCSASDTAAVQILPLPQASLTGYDSTRCQPEDTLMISPENPLWSIRWSGGGSPLAGGRALRVTADGTYSARVTDTQTGCAVQLSQRVRLGNPPELPFAQTSLRHCVADTLRLRPERIQTGWQYVWYSADGAVLSQSPELVILPEGDTLNLRLTVKSNAVCQTEQRLKVALEPVPNLRLLTPTTAICLGESLLITAETNAEEVLWYTGQRGTRLDFRPEAAGAYLIAAETRGTSSVCPSARDTLRIQVGRRPSATLPDTVRACVGDTVALFPSVSDTAIRYRWQDVNGTLLGESAPLRRFFAGADQEDIRLIISDITAICSDTLTTHIRWQMRPEVRLNSSAARLCLGDTLRLQAEGSGDFLWSTGTSGPVLVLPTTAVGRFPVIVTATGACTAARDTAYVDVQPLPSLILPDTLTLCAGDSLQVIAEGAQSYLWSNGQSGDTLWVNADTPSELLLTGTDSNGCTATRPLTIRHIPTTQLPAYRQACLGDTILLDATAPVPSSYLWQGVLAQPRLSVSGDGTYSVEITNADCAYRREVRVVFLPYPRVLLPSDTLLCLEDASTLTAAALGDAPAFAWEWRDAEGHIVGTAASLPLTTTGSYTATAFPVYPQKSCPASASVRVEELCAGEVFVPDAFSPNGDGLNETFEVFGTNFSEATLEIYNRWGMLIFVSPSGNPRWDGRDRFGKPVQIGTYTYRLRYQALGTEGYPITLKRTGQVRVVR